MKLTKKNIIKCAIILTLICNTSFIKPIWFNIKPVWIKRTALFAAGSGFVGFCLWKLYTHKNDNHLGENLLRLSSKFNILFMVRHLVETKFVNVHCVDSNGRTTRHLITPPHVLPANAHKFNAVRDYLQTKENEHQNLIDRVDTLKQDLDNNQETADQEIVDNAPARLQEIKDLIQNREIPGYAKQLVIPKILELHKDYPAIVTKEDMLSLCQHIAFNYSFVNDQQFRPVLDFALNNNIRDIHGKTVFKAASTYGQKDNVLKLLETRRPLYTSNNLFKHWLGEKPEPKKRWFFHNAVQKTKSFFCNIKNKVFGETRATGTQNQRAYDAKKDYTSTLDYLKTHGEKQQFRNMANTMIVMENMKKVKTPDVNMFTGEQNTMPDEIAAKIMGFAGTDFGKKVNFN